VRRSLPGRWHCIGRTTNGSIVGLWIACDVRALGGSGLDDGFAFTLQDQDFPFKRCRLLHAFGVNNAGFDVRVSANFPFGNSLKLIVEQPTNEVQKVRDFLSPIRDFYGV